MPDQGRDLDLSETAKAFRLHIEQLDGLVKEMERNIDNPSFVQGRHRLASLRLRSIVKEGQSWIPRLEAASNRVASINSERDQAVQARRRAEADLNSLRGSQNAQGVFRGTQMRQDLEMSRRPSKRRRFSASRIDQPSFGRQPVHPPPSMTYGSALGVQLRPTAVPPPMPSDDRSKTNRLPHKSDAFSRSDGLDTMRPRLPVAVSGPQSPPKNQAGTEPIQMIARNVESDAGQSERTVLRPNPPSRKRKPEDSTFDMSFVLPRLDIWHPDAKDNRMPATNAPPQLLAAFEPHWRNLFDSPSKTETLAQRPQKKTSCVRLKANRRPAEVGSGPSSCANCADSGEACMKTSPVKKPLIVPLPEAPRQGESWENPRFWFKK